MAGLGALNVSTYFTKELGTTDCGLYMKRNKIMAHLIFSTKYCSKEGGSKQDLCKYDDGILDSPESL